MQILRIACFLGCNALVVTGFGEDRDLNLVQTAPWPEIWGDFGIRGHATGDRVAPNGLEFDALFDIDFHLNIGLQPRKKLYTFLDGDFWGQRAAPGITNQRYGSYDFSKREYDFAAGLAWNVFDRLELRGSFFAFNNLNRGTSATVADAYENGVVFTARYYLGDANIYDTGRLSFVSLGFYPGENLIGGGGTKFRAGLFAEGYGSYDLPTLRSYLYIDVNLIGQRDVDLRLVKIDGGLGIRPFPSLPNLELRIGDEFNADLKDDVTHNLVYGALRAYFGGGAGSMINHPTPPVYDIMRSSEIWGDFGFSTDAAGRRIAPNGVEFTPLFMSNVDFNIGLLPAKKLYFFFDSQFWVQRESATGYVPGRDPAQDNVSEREWDFAGGLAFTVFGRFELRGSLFAQNNLNRGGSMQQPPSPVSPAGFHDGGYLQIRYYLTTANPYDPSRQSFVELGYYPTNISISGQGSVVHPRTFCRLYLSQDLPRIRSYMYGDGTLVAEDDSLGLFIVNAGLAIRPFERFNNLEFRIGNEFSREIGATTRDLTYGAIRINFSTR